MQAFKKFCLLAGAFLVVLSLTVATILYAFVDMDRYRSVIAERLSAATGMEVTIETLRFGVLRGVAFEGRNLVFNHPKSQKPYLTIKKLRLVLKTRPLLSKQVIVKRLDMENPVLVVATEKSPEELHIKPLATKLLKVSSDVAKQGFFLEVRSVDVRQGEIRFYRKGQQEHVASIEGLKLKLSGLKPLAPTRYALSGKFLVGTKTMSFSFEGATSNLPVRFDPALVAVEGKGRIENVPGRLLKSFLMPNGPVRALEGIFDIQTHYRGNLGGTVDAEGKIRFTSLYVDYPQLIKDPLRAEKGTISYALTFKEDTLVVRRFEIAAKETALKGSLTIEKFYSGKGTITGKLSTTTLDAKTLVKFLPPSTPLGVQEFVRTIEPSGQMELKRLEASGPVQGAKGQKEPSEALATSVDLVLKNLGLTLAPDIPPLKEWKGEVRYNPKKVVFHGVSGRLGNKSSIESLTGTILDIGSDNPRADLEIKAYLDASDFRGSLKKWLSREGFEVISPQARLEGALRAQISVEGPIKVPSKLKVSGKVFLEDLSLLDPDGGLEVERVRGTLEIRPREIEIREISLLIGGRPLRLSGQIEDLQQETVALRHGAVELGQGVLKLQGIEGTFDRANQVLTLKTADSAPVEGGLIRNFHMVISHPSENPSLKLGLEGTFSLERLRLLLAWARISPRESPLFRPLEEVQGLADLGLEASGPLKREPGVVWTASVALRDLDLPSGHPLDALKEAHGTFQLKAKTLTISEFRGSLGGSVLTLRGTIQDYRSAEPPCRITLETSDFKLSDALALLDLGRSPKVQGIISGKLTASGPVLTHPAESRIEGVLHLAEGFIGFRQTPPLEAIQARLRIEDREAVLEEARLMLQGSPVLLSGSIRGLREPIISIRARFENLDLDSLVAAREGESPWLRLLDRTLVLSEKVSEATPLRRAVLNMELEVGRGRFLASNFGPLRGQATLGGRKLVIKQAEIQTEVGLLRGDTLLDFSGTDPYVFTMKGELTDGDINRILKPWGSEWNILTGKLNIKASLKCREEGLVRGITGCLQGHVLVRLKDGYVRKTGVIVPLAEKLKFDKSFKRRRGETLPILPYKVISGDFAIQDGILTTNNFAIDGSKIRIATDGQVNLFHDTMDLKVSVLTFNAINQVIHKIPLLNLIAEDDKSLVATYYEVSGGVDEPQVVTIPNRSLEMVLIRAFHKIFQVPERIIRAPIDLLQQLPPPPKEAKSPTGASLSPN